MATRQDAHGLFASELKILEATDGGQSVESVARDLGVSVGYVRNIKTKFSRSWSMNDQFDTMSRRGTVALADRIDEVGGRWL